jgi:glycosyltransferase involved in cell wall biosynthesis
MAPRVNAEHDVAISAFYGLEGARLRFGDITVMPGLGRTYGSELIQAHANAHFGGDLRDGIVLSLMDVWVLDTRIWSTMNVAAWVPVDHDPAPPNVLRFFRETGAIPLAMSEFGMEQLAEFNPIHLPHGVDTSVYKSYDQAEARKAVGLPEDAFIVGMVAANKGNPSRKCFEEAIRAFAALRRRHKDAVLYLHTEIHGQESGVNLPALIQAVGLPEGSYCFTDQARYQFDPIPPALMAKVYSGLDVLLNPSAGEGFGIPVLESQACGTPVIVTDFSAMQEVCGAGWKVEYDKMFTAQRSWQARPDIADITDALEQCYRLPASHHAKLSEKAVAHAAKYDADLVAKQYFLPALEEVQRRIEDRKPTTLKAAA